MEEADAAEIARLSGQLGYPAGSPDIVRRFRALANLDGNALLVADDGPGGIVGWIHVTGRASLESEPFAEISGLVVREDARGRGAGRMLVEAAESWARRCGYAASRVRSNVIRSGARAFYEKLGYEIVKTQSVFTKRLDRDDPGGARPRRA